MGYHLSSYLSYHLYTWNVNTEDVDSHHLSSYLHTIIYTYLSAYLSLINPLSICPLSIIYLLMAYNHLSSIYLPTFNYLSIIYLAIGLSVYSHWPQYSISTIICLLFIYPLSTCLHIIIFISYSYLSSLCLLSSICLLSVIYLSSVHLPSPCSLSLFPLPSVFWTFGGRNSIFLPTSLSPTRWIPLH